MEMWFLYIYINFALHMVKYVRHFIAMLKTDLKFMAPTT